MWGQEGRALRVSTPTSSAEGLLPQASSMPVFPSACWLRSEWGLGREEEALLSLRPLTMAGRAPSQEFRDGPSLQSKGSVPVPPVRRDRAASLVAWLTCSQGARSGRAKTRTRAFLTPSPVFCLLARTPPCPASFRSAGNPASN